MQFGLATRNNLVLVALFAMAFGGVVFYVNASSHAEGAAPVMAVAPTIPAQDIEPPHGGTPANVPREPDPAIAQAEVAVPAAPPLTEGQTQDLQRWSNEVVSAHRTETRSDAIRSLGAVKNPESIRALAYALSSDEQAENRLLAVASLGALAREGYETHTIRDTLRLAAADTDQSVADHAKEAYDELMRKDEAPIEASVETQ